MEKASNESNALRAADGRVPGRRGLATRARLLEATAELLETGSYRDLRVVDIARSAGTSPATFYQYFGDVEEAILVLADDMAGEGVTLAEVVRGTGWDGQDGYDGARSLVDAFLRFWDEHVPVLRIVDLAIAEGDPRFREIRNRLLNPVTVALADVAGDLRDRHPGTVEPSAQAAVLVSMLAHVAEHQHGLEAWGVGKPAARESMARIIQWTLTGLTPPGEGR